MFFISPTACQREHERVRLESADGPVLLLGGSSTEKRLVAARLRRLSDCKAAAVAVVALSRLQLEAMVAAVFKAEIGAFARPRGGRGVD